MEKATHHRSLSGKVGEGDWVLSRIPSTAGCGFAAPPDNREHRESHLLSIVQHASGAFLRVPFFILLTFCLTGINPLHSAQNFELTQLLSDTAAVGGWTIRPEESSLNLGKVALLVPNPQPTDSRQGSGVGFLKSTSGGYSLSFENYYQDKVGAVKADVDGDGLADYLVWFSNRNFFNVFFGNNTPGSPTRVYEDTLRWGVPDSLAVDDLNGDGRPDILAWYSRSSYLKVLWQRPSPAGSDLFGRYDLYTISKSPSPEALNNERILFGDFNSDGYRDFIFKGYVFTGSSTGKFQPIPLTAGGSSYSRLLGAADIDGNGTEEILLARPATGTTANEILVAASWNSTSGLRDKRTFNSGLARIEDIRFEDFDSDHRADLLCIGSSSVTLLSGAEGFVYSAPDTVITWSGSQKFLGVADWRNDGILDWFFLPAGSKFVNMYSPVKPRFTEHTVQAGLDRRLAGNAVAVGDFNNDGLPDVYVVNGRGYNALFQGQPGGRFTDVAEQAGVHLGNDGISAAWGDYDNDGFQDLIIVGMNLPSKLYRNNGNGTFADSSQILGLDRAGQRATSVSWGDVNRDGWLDLLIANYDGANWLLINQNGRRFVEQSKPLGLTESYKTESVALVDVDNDGWLDIVTLNTDGPVRLLKGSAQGFTDITAVSGFNPDQNFKKFGMSQSWGDFNGDGYPDLYITRAQDVDALYMNTGRSGQTRFVRKFSDHIDGRYGRLAAAIADFKGDGFPDLLIGRSSVYGSFNSTGRALFLDNSGSGEARPYPEFGFPIANDPGFLQFSETSLPVPLDFDLDGDLDVLFVNFRPDSPSDLFRGSQLPLRLARNNAQFSRSLTVRLKRDRNRSAIGTRVTLFRDGRSFLQTVSGGSGRIQNGGNPLFAFGASSHADSLVVHWPQGGRQTLLGPLTPGFLDVAEDLTGPTIVSIPAPGEPPLSGVITSSTDTIHADLQVEDPSGVSWVRAIVSYSTGSRRDTLYAGPPDGNVYRVPRRSPVPGDSLYYYFEAADRFGNLSRLPAAGSYKLYNGDYNGPTIVSVPAPGEPPLSGEIISTTETIYANLQVKDPSGVNWVRSVISYASGTRQDTLYAGPPDADIYRVPRRSPVPGDSLYYYFEAADRFGNLSRMPETGSYMLKNSATRFRGDIVHDNRIDSQDLLRFLQIMGRQGDPASADEFAAADLNRDGKVDAQDLLILLTLIGGGGAKTEMTGTVGNVIPVSP